MSDEPRPRIFPRLIAVYAHDTSPNAIEKAYTDAVNQAHGGMQEIRPVVTDYRIDHQPNGLVLVTITVEEGEPEIAMLEARRRQLRMTGRRLQLICENGCFDVEFGGDHGTMQPIVIAVFKARPLLACWRCNGALDVDYDLQDGDLPEMDR